MTFSIVALEPKTGHFGIAVATAHLAVGALVPHAKAGVGAVATQAASNPYLATDILQWIQAGYPVQSALNLACQSDPDIETRQVHLVDYQGNTAGWTGVKAFHWAGHMNFSQFSVAGNRLAGPQVLDAMASCYQGNSGTPLTDRLLRALEAGEEAGGDLEGITSSALCIMGNETFLQCDLRVDFDNQPLDKLFKLLQEHRKAYVRNLFAGIPSRPARQRAVDIAS